MNHKSFAVVAAWFGSDPKDEPLPPEFRSRKFDSAIVNCICLQGGSFRLKKVICAMKTYMSLAKDGFKPTVIFDVGANRGATIAVERSIFPEAKIYAFEPVSTTYKMLSDAHGADENVVLNHMALNDFKGNVLMRASPGSYINHIIDKAPAKTITESVEGETGDNYCRDRGIDYIDFLKIDTEGNDLRVLHGFEGMVRAKKIKFIQVECGTDPNNKFHVPLQHFLTHMYDRGYGLHAVYDFARDRKSKEKLRNIRMCNALFMISHIENSADVSEMSED